MPLEQDGGNVSITKKGLQANASINWTVLFRMMGKWPSVAMEHNSSILAAMSPQSAENNNLLHAITII